MSDVKESSENIEESGKAVGDQAQDNGLEDNQPDAVVEVLEGEIVAEEGEGEEPAAKEAALEAEVDGAETEDLLETDEEAADEFELSAEETLIAELQAELAEVRAEAAAQTDQVQRIAAEFQNSKKRQERQLADSIQRASSHLATQLLPILDDFDLAFGNLPEELSDEDESWVDGFRQIHKKLAAVLEDQGVTMIQLDGEFDPNLHEAISSEPNDVVESGHIIETLRAGYEFKGRVLRPAMVRVAM
jgi:molecular chaperone GrpE